MERMRETNTRERDTRVLTNLFFLAQAAVIDTQRSHAGGWYSFCLSLRRPSLWRSIRSVRLFSHSLLQLSLSLSLFLFTPASFPHLSYIHTFYFLSLQLSYIPCSIYYHAITKVFLPVGSCSSVCALAFYLISMYLSTHHTSARLLARGKDGYICILMLSFLDRPTVCIPFAVG